MSPPSWYKFADLKFLLIGAGVFVSLILVVGSLPGSASQPCYGAASSLVEPAHEVADGELTGLAAERVVDGLDEPVDMFTLPGHDSLFVVEKPGRIVRVGDGGALDPPVLDMSALVLNGGNEQGLLTVLPDPDFALNCRIYLFYTDSFGDSRLARATVSGVAEPSVDIRTLQTVLEIPQHQDWHQSGSMIFGPDGYLWVSVGDGGGIADPHGHGQNPYSLEATILRLDVASDRYEIPADNPFADSDGGRPEVWAYGLRNPWRISIDPPTRRLYIPDVGQANVEEIDIVDMSDAGRNFGWSVTEGSGCFEATTCDTTGITMPVYEYEHENTGCAIVGGQVYRGQAIPELDGQYFFADFCSGWIRSLAFDGTEVTGTTNWEGLEVDRLITSFGADQAGELYFMNLDGGLWRIVAMREPG